MKKTSRLFLYVGIFLILVIFLWVGTGCRLFSPSAKSIPKNGAREINPFKGIKIFTLGFGTKITRLEVRANGKKVQAKLNQDGQLLVNGRKRLETDTRYEIRLWLKGWRGKKAYRRFVFNTVTTPKPLLSKDTLLLVPGQKISIRWNIPIAKFKYELPPEVKSQSKLDKTRKLATISILNYKQGQQFELKIIDAWGMNGFRMKETNPGYVLKIETLPPLTVEVDPAYGERGVSRSATITLTFSEEVGNPGEVEKSLNISPQIDGTISWPQPNVLQFVPSSSWDYDTEVSIFLKGGPDGVKGVRGNYLETDLESYFVTIPYKTIDVNLTTQTLTLLEAGKPIFSTLVSTGKPGYETPTGTFSVYAKDRVAEMRSSETAIEFYYIPDVPFVLWFYGGYSIHGAYWHNEFGRVRSHGCVNVPMSNAEYIYNWAPVGTPVIIHY